MNILFVLFELEGGGSERVSVNIANSCVKNGDNVFFIVSSIDAYKTELSSNIKIIQVSNSPILFLSSLIKSIRRYDIDVCFSAMTLPNYLSGMARLFVPFKLIQRQTFVICGKLNVKQMLKIKCQSFIYNKLCSRVIANSYQTANNLKHIYKVRDEKIEIIGNPVFDKSIYTRSNESVSLPFDETMSYILSIGSLRKEKNYEFLIEAFAKISNNCKENLLIIGSGVMKNVLLDKIFKLNLEERIFIKDFVENPYPYYKKSRLFVSSSSQESFGNVIVEAMCFGKQIVSTNTGGAKFILQDGKYGLICESYDIDKFAACILEGLRNSTKSNELVKERANDFSIDLISEKYKILFCK